MKKVLSFVLLAAMVFGFAVTPAKAAPSVDAIVSGMSTEQKIRQMLMMDFRKWKCTGESEAADLTVMNDEVRKIIEDYDLGAVIYFAENIKTTEDTFNFTMEMQAAAMKDGGIPLLIATDQEGGIVYRLGSGTALPGNMALGATQDPDYAEQAGRIIGSELSSLGINVTLAPIVDVNNNANNPVIGLRSYSDDADTVGRMASACISGMAEYDVIGCAKHFPGHGDTATDSHYGLPSVDKPLDVLLENELAPYQIAIEQGIDMIMTAHILYPQLENDKIYSEKTKKEESLPATMSDDIITGLLKGTFGFDGIVCTDAMNMEGVSENWNEVQAVVNAISAGVDLICMPTSVTCMEELPKLDALISGVAAQVGVGKAIPESRLDDACRRILTVKAAHGILDFDPADYSLAHAQDVVGCAENRAAEREMAAKAVTLIQNKNDTLPVQFTDSSRVLMLTPYTNELVQHAMGWNRAKDAGIVPDGAEVRIVRYENKGEPYDISAYKADIDWADTVLITTEVGSSSVKNNSWVFTGPCALLDYAGAKNKTTVIMSISLPYDVQFYTKADAVIAVYGNKGLNGTAAEETAAALINGTTESKTACGPNIAAGVEVALGVFDAAGVLPVNIPVFDKAAGGYTDKIAYARGYGMTYTDVRTRLQNTVSAAQKLIKSEYTEGTWQALDRTMENAVRILNDKNASREAVYAALSALRSAMNALKTDPVPNTGDNTLIAVFVLIGITSLTSLMYLSVGRKKKTGKHRT